MLSCRSIKKVLRKKFKEQRPKVHCYGFALNFSLRLCGNTCLYLNSYSKQFFMSVAEMKLEAISKISNLKNEEVLQEVLALLNSVNEKETLSLSKNYEVIKEQYGEVLQKLAQ